MVSNLIHAHTNSRAASHPRGLDRVRFGARDADPPGGIPATDAPSGRVRGGGERADPDELDGGEGGADARDGADGAEREGDDVDRHLELQEPPDVVVHRPAPPARAARWRAGHKGGGGTSWTLRLMNLITQVGEVQTLKSLMFLKFLMITTLKTWPLD